MPSSKGTLSFVPKDQSFHYDPSDERNLAAALDSGFCKLTIGLRVVRGSDDSESDGGEGFVGTVVEVGGKSSSLPENLVWVQWDSGTRQDYQADSHGAYDLCVLDSSPTGVKHAAFMCSACKQTPILGMRWHCLDCKKSCTDLCTTCYMKDEHTKKHVFQRFDGPGIEGCTVGVRINAPKIQAMGIFRGAKVMRGPDWKWGNQDGGKGKEGAVQKITDWRATPASAAVVSWDFADKGNYRLGYKGKVDLRCTAAGVGGYYYKSHLPKLGEEPRSQRTCKEPEHTPDQSRSRTSKARADMLSRSVGSYLSKPSLPTFPEDANNNSSGSVTTDNKAALVTELSSEGGNHTSLLSAHAHLSAPHDDTESASTCSLVPNKEPSRADSSSHKRELAAVEQRRKAEEAKASRSALHKAAIKGQCETVKSLLDNGEDVDQRDKFSLTPLHLAAWYGQELVVKVLLEHGADVDVKDRFHKTPLQKAQRHNHRAIVELLLKKNATPSRHQPFSLMSLAIKAFVAIDRKSGFNLLQAAALEADYDTAIDASIFLRNDFIREMNFESTANNAKKVPGKTACDILSTREEKGHKDIKDLYQQQTEKAETFTEIHRCVQNDDTEMAVELVLENDVDVNLPAQSHRTPLFLASASSSSVLIETLIDLGADLNAQRDDKITPLMLATSWNNYMAAHRLMEYGVDADMRDNFGSGSLYKAVHLGHFNMLRLLIKSECNLNAKNKNGITPLHLAAKNGRKHFVQLLLKNGADVSVRDLQTLGERVYIVRGKDKGKAAWHYVLVDKPLLGLFLKRSSGGNLDVKDFGAVLDSGWGQDPPESKREEINKQTDSFLEEAQDVTPLHLACQNNNLEIIDLLVEYGADIDAVDADGYTSLQIAAVRGNLDVVKKLVELKADINLVTSDGKDAVQLAALNEEPEIEEYLKLIRCATTDTPKSDVVQN